MDARRMVLVIAVVLMPGCVQPDAVHVAPQMPVLSGNETATSKVSAGDVGTVAVATSQPVRQEAPVGGQAPCAAGSESSAWSIGAIQLAGSGWPLLVGLAVVGLLAIYAAERRRRVVQERNIAAVGQAVAAEPNSAVRDQLLGRIEACLVAGDRPAFDAVLQRRGLYRRRRRSGDDGK